MNRKPRWAGLTDPGLIKLENEDSFFLDPERGLAVLADGMGGARGGAVASALAVTTLRDYLLTRWQQREEGESQLSAAIGAANEKVFQRAAANPELRGMGTTVFVALRVDHHLDWAHVGDSRLYLYRKDHLDQISQDHNMVRQLEREGVIMPGSDASLRYRHMLSRAVGLNETVEPETGTIELESGDTVLLCTDGLSEMLDDAAMTTLLAKHVGDPVTACARLVEAAKERGGKDNITVVLLTL